MDTYDESTYGDRWAEIYDEWFPTHDEAAIETLSGLANKGAVLELGIGTGRFALPLAARGLAVQGLDASTAMIAKLRAKPGGEKIPVTMGNMIDVAVPGEFDMIFIVFNTFFTLPSQDEQVKCLSNIAMRLKPGGVFVMEAFVPDLARFDRGQASRAMQVGAGIAALELSKHDILHQRVTSQIIVFQEGGPRMYPIQIRYAWPSELDLMARLAGLRLRDRWANWRREPFTAQSPSHISVYERGE